MKTLRMLSSHEGSPDGIHVKWFLAGQTYDVSESLSAIFLKEGWAVDDAALPVAESARAEVTTAPGHKQEYRRKR